MNGAGDRPATQVAVETPTRGRVVISGSMSFYPEMVRVQDTLARLGVQAVVPDPDAPEVLAFAGERFESFRRQRLFAHLRQVRDPRTFAVVAVNLDKYGIPDYLGPNTFAAVSIAFAQSKRIYLWQGFPDAFGDELRAWRATALHGDPRALARDVMQDARVRAQQLRLF